MACVVVIAAALMVATVDVVVHHINSSNTTAPTPARPMMQDPPAKFVTTRDTHPLSAGTGSMSLMAQITKVHVLFMAWTQIGMWILELLIMLLETLKSFPLVIVMVARTRSKQQMVQVWKSSGMEITHVGNSIVQTRNRDLYLNNILLCP